MNVSMLIDHGVVEVPAGAANQIASTLLARLQAGRDAFLDHERVPPEDRDTCKALIEEHGGQWCLITFTVDHAPLATRLGGASEPTRD